MDQKEVLKKLDNINTGLKSYVQVLDTKIIAYQDHQNELINVITQDVELKLAGITATLLRATSVLAVRATYGTLRVTLHSSPEIFAIIMAMVTI